MMDIVRQSSLSYGSGSAWDACGQHYLPHAVHSSTLPDRHTAQAHTELWLDDDSPSMAMLGMRDFLRVHFLHGSLLPKWRRRAYPINRVDNCCGEEAILARTAGITLNLVWVPCSRR